MSYLSHPPSLSVRACRYRLQDGEPSDVGGLQTAHRNSGGHSRSPDSEPARLGHHQDPG